MSKDRDCHSCSKFLSCDIREEHKKFKNAILLLCSQWQEDKKHKEKKQD